MRKVVFTVVLLVASSLLIGSCKNKDTDNKEEFDKGPVLQNLADQIILPGYDELQLKMNAFQQNWNAFLFDPVAGNFDAVKTSWTQASIAFQAVKMFEFGPAATVGLSAALGTFPADTTQIKSNINTGNYTLTTADNIDAIGFDALDYLFYRSNALVEIQINPSTQNYVTAVISKMKTEVDAVNNGWKTGYRETFIAGTGTSSTSPFSLLFNAFSKDFESTKTTKIGVPIGIQTLGIQQPHFLEARRSGIGSQLLLSNYTAAKNVFLGIGSNGANGQGFDNYLMALERSDLSATIETRFNYLINQPTTWSARIEDMMSSNPTELNNYYNYIQGTVVYIKTDMASAFGVLITYQDNDGD